MPYTIELQLNRAAEAKFLKQWDILRDAKITDLSYRLGYRPHITLAMYHEIDEAKIVAKLEKFITTETIIPVEFRHITIAGQSIFCQPIENGALRKFHTRFVKVFGKSFRDADQAGTWTPHCSVGMDVPAGKIGLAVDRLAAAWNPIPGIADRLALVKFRPGQVLWRKPLKRA